MNNFKTSLLAGFVAMSGSLAAQDFPTTENTKKDLNVNLQYEGKDKIEDMEGYKKLIDMLSKGYEQRKKNNNQAGDLGAVGCRTCKNIDHVPLMLVPDWETLSFEKDFYEKLLHEEFPIIAKSKSFHREVSVSDGEIIVDGARIQEDFKTTFGLYGSVSEEDFEHYLRKAKDANLLFSSADLARRSADHNDTNNTYVNRLAGQPQGEQLISVILDYYYEKVKNDFDTISSQGVYLNKPSDRIFRFAEKNGFTLVPKLYILRDMNDTDLNLRGFYLRVPEKKPDAIRPKDTVPQITKEEVKIQEEKMNEIFDYGQKEIFVTNSTNFKNESVKQSLDTLYKMLDENKNLDIVVTGYYGGKHATLPKQRAEAVKKYLIAKGIDPQRIETVGGAESFARSIQIKIVIEEK